MEKKYAFELNYDKKALEFAVPFSTYFLVHEALFLMLKSRL
jgi:hypothetical protein